MLYTIDLRLVVMAVNKSNPANTLVLLQKDKSCRKLPSLPLQYGHSFISICTEEVNRIFGLSGQWKETRPRQVGVFEVDADKLLLVYSLLMPEKIDIKRENYEWAYLDRLDSLLTEEFTKEIIKFAVLQGDNYVV